MKQGFRFALAALCLIAGAARAQTVRGTAVDATSRPLLGVVVLLIDSTSTVAARALTNERGEFRLVSARAGVFRVRALRIGFRPETSPPIRVGIGQELEQRLVLSGLPISLDTIRVVERNSCGNGRDSAAAVFAAWEQARTALTATQLTGVARNIAATTVIYERTLDPLGKRVQKQTASISADFVTQPWRSVSADSLRRGGYVVTDTDGGTVYFAPGIDVLLSNAFVEDHCLRLVTERGSPRVGIGFEPTSARRRVPEIRGTLWLDRATSELQRLEFSYDNVSVDQRGIAAGEMEFVRMKNGAWAVSRWSIKMPVLEQVMRSRDLGGEHVRIAEVRVAGGELALARRGNDTLWSRPPLVLGGTVQDSASGAAIIGARVALAGTALGGVSDTRGRFSILGVFPGEYTLEVRTASLDSVSAVHQSPIAITDAVASVELRVPGAQQIVGAVCGRGSGSGPGAGIVLGRVSARADSLPPRSVRVLAEWTDLSLRAEGNAVATDRTKRWLETRTDARGGFRVCGVPVNTALSITAEGDSSAGTPVEVRIPPGGRFARTDLVLDRREVRGAAVLTGVVVADSTNVPIIGAEVMLPSLSKSVLTNERGAFRVTDIPTGTHRVVVRRVGYGPADTPIEFAAGQTVDKRVVLGRAITLDSVVVTAAHRNPLLEEFEENRKLGLGHFLTRAEIAKLEGLQLNASLEGIPGLRLIYASAGRYAWIMSSRTLSKSMYYPEKFERSQGMKIACYAQVFLDGTLMNRPVMMDPQLNQGSARGMRATPPFDVNSIPPTQIEAVEYYAGPAQTPLRYAGYGSECGVLLIHTRRVK